MMRKSKGRQKVELTKMAKESNLQVTFSKRRSGLFKKASELCTLCGAEIAVIVFSPGKKVYSFGHPGVETIIDRFLARSPLPSSGSLQLLEAHRSANVRDLNVLLTQVLNELEGERKYGEELAEVRKACQARYWWAGQVEEFSFEQLELLKVSLENLKKNVAVQLDKKMIMKAADHHPVTFFPPSDGQMLRLDPRSFNLGYGGSFL